MRFLRILVSFVFSSFGFVGFWGFTEWREMGADCGVDLKLKEQE